MADFNMKVGDTSPAIKSQLQDNDGNAVDITGASVNFHLFDQDGNSLVDASATVDNASEGKVKYSWSSGDTDTAGMHNAEWEVTFSDGSIESFPNTENLKVQITPELA